MKKMTKKFISLAMSAVMAVSVCPAVNASETRDLDNPVVLRFIVGSDAHMASKTGESTTKFKNMFKSAYEYAGKQDYKTIDAAILLGDIVDRGRPAEYVDLKETIKACNIAEDTQVYMTMGNHEWWAYTNDGETSTAGKKSFLEGLASIDEIDNKTDDFSVNIKGYQFIGMSPLHNDTYGKDKYDWMKKEVTKAKNADSTKAIFTFQHHALKDTVYCSDMQSSYVYNNEADSLYACYDGVQQVINFSGHSHAPINTPTAINQTTFTQYTTGSMYSIWLDESASTGRQPADPSKIGQYTIVEVTKDGNVRLMPYDTLTDKFFTTISANDAEGTQLIYDVDVNDKSGWKYTADKREKTAPYFETDDKVNATDVTFKSAVLTIDQAKDDTGVYAYDIELSSEGKENKKYRIFSEWWLEDMPKTVSYKASGLEAATKYKANVYPVDFYGNRGDAISTEFTTEDAINSKLILTFDQVDSSGTWWFETNNSNLMTSQYYKVPVSIDGKAGYVVISKQNNGEKACIWPNFFTDIYKMNQPTKSFRIDNDIVIKSVNTSWTENGEDEITIETGLIVKNTAGVWIAGDIEQEPDEDPEVYNVNYADAGDFESGTVNGKLEIRNGEVVTDRVHTGNKAGKLTGEASQVVVTSRGLEAGKIYQFSAWIYVPKDAIGEYYELGFIQTLESDFSGTMYKTDWPKITGYEDSKGQWYLYTYNFQYLEGRDIAQFVISCKKDFPIWIDDIQVKRYHDCVGEDVEGYAPTYDKEGMKPGKKCPICGKVFEGCESIPKLVRPTTTTPQQTTAKPQVTTTTTTTTKTLKAKIKKIDTKKLKSKKLCVKLTRIKGAKKYEIQVSTSKKFKKVLVKKTTKKITYTFNDKKLKNKKKLYVRARVQGSKFWTKAKSVKIKK